LRSRRNWPPVTGRSASRKRSRRCRRRPGTNAARCTRQPTCWTSCPSPSSPRPSRTCVRSGRRRTVRRPRRQPRRSPTSMVKGIGRRPEQSARQEGGPASDRRSCTTPRATGAALWGFRESGAGAKAAQRRRSIAEAGQQCAWTDFGRVNRAIPSRHMLPS